MNGHYHVDYFTKITELQKCKEEKPLPFDSENVQHPKLEVFKEPLDLIESEFERRFVSENIKLWKAMEALSPKSSNYLNYKILKPLYDYAVTIPVLTEIFVEQKVLATDLKAECRIFSRTLEEKTWPVGEHGKIDLVVVGNIMAKAH